MKNTLIALGLLAMASCKNDPKTTADNAGDTINRQEAPAGDIGADTSMNAQAKMDITGTYQGVLPCADCQGIATTLKIGADTTYEMTVAYMGKKDKLGSTSKGKYRWYDGKIIELEGINNAPSKYEVGASQITQLDVEGHKIQGAQAGKYVLAKK